MQSYYFQYRASDFSSALLFLLWLVLSFQCKPPNDSDTPNIIIINVDDMGWRDLGYTGSEFYESKYIDSLAAMGAVLSVIVL